MNKFLSLLFCCILGFSLINANDSSETFFTHENQVSIDESTQYSLQLYHLADIADKNEEGALSYFHRIKEVDIEDRAVYLEDGSKWNIGYWHTDAIANWEMGDRLAISWGSKYNGFGLQNLDKGSLAWASIWKWNFPTADKSDFVVEISEEDPRYGAIITLKSGFQFGIPSFWLFGPTFKVRDPVFVFLKGSVYSILNMKTTKMAESTTLITIGNPDWRQEP